MIKQFLSDVAWGELEYLIIDTPPGTICLVVQLVIHFPDKFNFLLGTSDEHITVVESLQTYSPDGAILVSTPQVCV